MFVGFVLSIELKYSTSFFTAETSPLASTIFSTNGFLRNAPNLSTPLMFALSAFDVLAIIIEPFASVGVPIAVDVAARRKEYKFSSVNKFSLSNFCATSRFSKKPLARSFVDSPFAAASKYLLR